MQRTLLYLKEVMGANKDRMKNAEELQEGRLTAVHMRRAIQGPALASTAVSCTELVGSLPTTKLRPLCSSGAGFQQLLRSIYCSSTLLTFGRGESYIN